MVLLKFGEGGLALNLGSINHLLFSVSDLEKSILFYEGVFGAKLVYKRKKTAYFDLNGLWLALNEEKNIPRNEIKHSYTHIAFSIDEEDFEKWSKHLQQYDVHILSDRTRDPGEQKSIYFTDPDGHKFELHTGSLQDRLAYYENKYGN